MNPPLSLVGWWPFDTDAADRTQNQNDGTAMGVPPSVTGEVQGAYSFNGTTQYVKAPNSTSLNFGAGKNLQIDAWVKVAKPGDLSGVRVIVDKRTFSGVNKPIGYSFFLYNGHLGLQLADNLYSNYVSTGPVVAADNKWHFIGVAVTRSSTGGIRYILDGAANGSPMNPRIIWAI